MTIEFRHSLAGGLPSRSTGSNSSSLGCLWGYWRGIGEGGEKDEGDEVQHLGKRAVVIRSIRLILGERIRGKNDCTFTSSEVVKNNKQGKEEQVEVKKEKEEDEEAVETCQQTKEMKPLPGDGEDRRRYGRKQRGKRKHRKSESHQG